MKDIRAVSQYLVCEQFCWSLWVMREISSKLIKSEAVLTTEITLKLLFKIVTFHNFHKLGWCQNNPALNNTVQILILKWWRIFVLSKCFCPIKFNIYGCNTRVFSLLNINGNSPDSFVFRFLFNLSLIYEIYLFIYPLFASFLSLLLLLIHLLACILCLFIFFICSFFSYFDEFLICFYIYFSLLTF